MMRQQTLKLAAAAFAVFLFCTYFVEISPPVDSSSSSSGVGVGVGVATRLPEKDSAYRGTPWHNERTLSVETLGKSKFA